MSGSWCEVTAATAKTLTRRQVIWALTLACGHTTTRACPHRADPPKRVRCHDGQCA